MIYESENIVVFLDKYPLYQGHSLVVTRNHYRDITEVPDEILGEMISLAKKLSIAFFRKLGASGVRIVMNNGSSAGQEIMHAHMHVIPYGVKHLGRRELEHGEGVKLSEMLKDALNEIS